MNEGNFSVFNESNFNENVLGRSGLTIVDFWSTTCAPCRQLTKVLTQLQQTLPDNVVIGTVDADQNGSLVERFNVRTMPTVLFIKNGAVVEVRTGVDRPQVLKKIIETHA